MRRNLANDNKKVSETVKFTKRASIIFENYHLLDKKSDIYY